MHNNKKVSGMRVKVDGEWVDKENPENINLHHDEEFVVAFDKDIVDLATQALVNRVVFSGAGNPEFLSNKIREWALEELKYDPMSREEYLEWADNYAREHEEPSPPEQDFGPMPE